MKKAIILMLAVIFLMSFAFAENDNSIGGNSGCKYKYWIDNNNTDCSQKQFCGDYMYYGLQTFEEKKDCLKEVNKTEDNENEDFNSGCKYRYWVDNENKSCGQRQFCGAFMYYGLRTFEDKEDCLQAINNVQVRERAREHNGSLKMHENNISIHAGENDNEDEIEDDGIRAGTRLNLTTDENETSFGAKLSNGRYAIVKIMPSTASQVALQNMQAKCDVRNCTVELKEVGKGNQTQIAYEVKAEKNAKLFYLFQTKMQVKAEVDAETGQIIDVKKPWWAFLAKEENN